MNNELSIYEIHKHFYFKQRDSLASVCNAPKDKGGVYLVFAINNDVEELIYIGCSGKREADGSLKIRKAGLGGMKDRIVNGHQFGKIPRRKSWVLKMKEEKIEKLHVKWWVTYDTQIKHFPEDIESQLLRKYFEIYNRLPRWNREF